MRRQIVDFSGGCIFYEGYFVIKPSLLSTIIGIKPLSFIFLNGPFI